MSVAFCSELHSHTVDGLCRFHTVSGAAWLRQHSSIFHCSEPVPARLKEWAYAGFAINLATALIAHLSVGGGHRGALEVLVLLAPSAGHASERLTAFQGQVESLRWF